MKIFCCFTPAHRLLFDQYFAPSLPKSFDLHATEFPLEGRGDFLSPEFLECIRLKVVAIVESITANPDSLILWSDIDIQFFADPVRELTTLAADSKADLFFQREDQRSKDVNTGFILIRCTTAAREFFEGVEERLRASRIHNEQWIVNNLLPGFDRRRWDYLPWRYYARTHGWPPPRDLALYHANFTMGADGIGQKIRQFREVTWVRRWGPPALLLSCLKRVPGKIHRSWRQRIATQRSGAR